MSTREHRALRRLLREHHKEDEVDAIMDCVTIMIGLIKIKDLWDKWVRQASWTRRVISSLVPAHWDKDMRVLQNRATYAARDIFWMACHSRKTLAILRSRKTHLGIFLDEVRRLVWLEQTKQGETK